VWARSFVDSDIGDELVEERNYCPILYGSNGHGHRAPIALPISLQVTGHRRPIATSETVT
jgi:hypothetical protein